MGKVIVSLKENNASAANRNKTRKHWVSYHCLCTVQAWLTNRSWTPLLLDRRKNCTQKPTACIMTWVEMLLAFLHCTGERHIEPELDIEDQAHVLRAVITRICSRGHLISIDGKISSFRKFFAPGRYISSTKNVTGLKLPGVTRRLIMDDETAQAVHEGIKNIYLLTPTAAGFGRDVATKNGILCKNNKHSRDDYLNTMAKGDLAPNKGPCFAGHKVSTARDGGRERWYRVPCIKGINIKGELEGVAQGDTVCSRCYSKIIRARHKQGWTPTPTSAIHTRNPAPAHPPTPPPTHNHKAATKPSLCANRRRNPKNTTTTTTTTTAATTLNTGSRRTNDINMPVSNQVYSTDQHGGIFVTGGGSGSSCGATNQRRKTDTQSNTDTNSTGQKPTAGANPTADTDNLPSPAKRRKKSYHRRSTHDKTEKDQRSQSSRNPHPAEIPTNLRENLSFNDISPEVISVSTKHTSGRTSFPSAAG